MNDANTNKISADIKLYVEKRANKARNEAIGILSFVALIISVITALGAYQGAKSFATEEFAKTGIGNLKTNATSEVAAISALHTEAQKSSSEISEMKDTYKNELAKVATVNQVLPKKLEGTIERIVVGSGYVRANCLDEVHNSQCDLKVVAGCRAKGYLSGLYRGATQSEGGFIEALCLKSGL